MYPIVSLMEFLVLGVKKWDDLILLRGVEGEKIFDLPPRP